EAEVGLAHKHVLGLSERVGAHVAAHGDLGAVAAVDETAAEPLEPLAFGKSTRVVEDLPNAEVDEVAYLVERPLDIHHRELRKRGCPRAEGAPATAPPPAVAPDHGVGARRVLEVAVVVGVQLPVR